MSEKRVLLGAFAILGVFVIENPHCGSTAGHRQQALYYLDQGRYDRALVEARRAVREHGDDAAAHFAVAMAQLGLKQLEAAVESLGQTILADPGNPQFYAALRQVCQESQRFDLARDAFARLGEALPENPLVQANLGWAFAHLDDEAPARQWLERAAFSESAAVFALAQLGQLHLRHGRFAEAIQALEQALEREPGDPALLLAMGEGYLRWGQPAEAERRFAEALEHSRDRAATAGQIAMVYYGLGLRRRAIDYYEQALGQGEAQPSLLNNLAWTYGEEGLNLDRALELSLQAVKSDAENPVYLDTYAELFYKKGDCARAIALMRRALEAEPEGGGQREYLEGQLQKFQQGLHSPSSL